MHDSAVNLDLHGNRFTSLDLENQGAAVGQVLVGRIKSDGLFVNLGCSCVRTQCRPIDS